MPSIDHKNIVLFFAMVLPVSCKLNVPTAGPAALSDDGSVAGCTTPEEMSAARLKADASKKQKDAAEADLAKVDAELKADYIPGFSDAADDKARDGGILRVCSSRADTQVSRCWNANVDGVDCNAQKTKYFNACKDTLLTVDLPKLTARNAAKASLVQKIAQLTKVADQDAAASALCEEQWGKIQAGNANPPKTEAEDATATDTKTNLVCPPGLEMGTDRRCYNFKKCRDLSAQTGKTYVLDINGNCFLTDKTIDTSGACFQGQIRNGLGVCVEATSFGDTDMDGVIDSQDKCPSTPYMDRTNVSKSGDPARWGCAVTEFPR